jgi:hypothetical protein
MGATYTLLFYLCLFSMIIASMAGLFKYKYLDTAMRLLVASLILTSISEICCYVAVIYARYLLRCNIYHFYDIIQSILTTAYFIYAIKPHHYRKLLLLNFIFWPAIGISNIIFFQPLGTLNTNMLMVESFVFITLSLYFIYLTLKNDKVANIFKDAYFRIAVIILCLWSSSFFFWALVDFLFQGKWKYADVTMYLQSLIEAMAYFGIAATLYFYDKRIELNK